jgi:hypothetical protein
MFTGCIAGCCLSAAEKRMFPSKERTNHPYSIFFREIFDNYGCESRKQPTSLLSNAVREKSESKFIQRFYSVQSTNRRYPWRVQLCAEFSSSDRRASCFWIASSYEGIRKRRLSKCKSLASVTFDSNTKVSRFDGKAFSGSGLTSIHIPSLVKVICEYCFSGCDSLASVTRDPGSKLRLTRSGLLSGVPFSYR